MSLIYSSRWETSLQVRHIFGRGQREIGKLSFARTLAMTRNVNLILSPQLAHLIQSIGHPVDVFWLAAGERVYLVSPKYGSLVMTSIYVRTNERTEF